MDHARVLLVFPGFAVRRRLGRGPGGEAGARQPVHGAAPRRTRRRRARPRGGVREPRRRRGARGLRQRRGAVACTALARRPRRDLVLVGAAVRRAPSSRPSACVANAQSRDRRRRLPRDGPAGRLRVRRARPSTGWSMGEAENAVRRSPWPSPRRERPARAGRTGSRGACFALDAAHLPGLRGLPATPVRTSPSWASSSVAAALTTRPPACCARAAAAGTPTAPTMPSRSWMRRARSRRAASTCSTPPSATTRRGVAPCCERLAAADRRDLRHLDHRTARRADARATST